jgi:hypothetical protein
LKERSDTVNNLKTLLRHRNLNFVTIRIWLVQRLLELDYRCLVVIVETHLLYLLVELLLLVEVLIEIGMIGLKELTLASLHLLNLLLLEKLHRVVEI